MTVQCQSYVFLAGANLGLGVSIGNTTLTLQYSSGLQTDRLARLTIRSTIEHCPDLSVRQRTHTAVKGNKGTWIGRVNYHWLESIGIQPTDSLTAR